MFDRTIAKITKANSDNAVIAIIGICFGLMATTSDFFATVMISISLIYLALFGYKSKVTLGMLLIAQYLIVQFFINIYHYGLHLSGGDQLSNLVFLVLLLPISNLIHHIKPNMDSFERYVYIGLAGSIGLMILDYYTNSFGLISVCRVAVFSLNPLMSAAAVLMVFFPLLAARIGQRLEISHLQGVILAAVIVAIGALLGARMAFYAMLVIVFFLMLFLLAHSHVRSAAKILGYAALGVVALLAIDGQSDCRFAIRITHQVEHLNSVVKMVLNEPKNSAVQDSQDISTQVPLPLDAPTENQAIVSSDQISPDANTNVAEPIPDEVMSAGGSRAELWKIAFDAIGERPLIGYGILSEVEIISTQIAGKDRPHFHNQFLSWMIWGGVIGLISGVILIFSPFFVLKDRLAATVFSFGWIAVLISDSFFLWPSILAWYIFGLLIYERVFSHDSKI